MMKKELKSIELDDLKELQTMLKDFWTTQLVEASKADILEDIRRLLSPKCYSYLIMCDDNIAGFIYINEKYGYVNNIEYLYIKEKFRGNGLGSFALSKIKEILKEDGLDRVQIEVNPSNLKFPKSGISTSKRMRFNARITVFIPDVMPSINPLVNPMIPLTAGRIKFVMPFQIASVLFFNISQTLTILSLILTNALISFSFRLSTPLNSPSMR